MKTVYYDTESQKVMSFSDIVNCYTEHIKDTENVDLTLNQYINSVLHDKNSCVKKMYALSDDEKMDILHDLANFENAFSRLYSALAIVNDESFNSELARNYPFGFSFDEMPCAINTWHDDIHKAIKADKLCKNG